MQQRAEFADLIVAALCSVRGLAASEVGQLRQRPPEARRSRCMWHSAVGSLLRPTSHARHGLGTIALVSTSSYLPRPSRDVVASASRGRRRRSLEVVQGECASSSSRRNVTLEGVSNTATSYLHVFRSRFKKLPVSGSREPFPRGHPS